MKSNKFQLLLYHELSIDERSSNDRMTYIRTIIIGHNKFSVIVLMRDPCKCSFIFHKGTRYQVNRWDPMSREDTGGDDLAVTYRATAVWCSERIDQRWKAIPEDSGCKGLKTHQSAIVTSFPLHFQKSPEFVNYWQVNRYNASVNTATDNWRMGYA